MNTSAHVNLDSKTKIVNLSIALSEVWGLLQHEGRASSALAVAEAHWSLRDALDRHGIIHNTEGATND